MEEVKEEDDYDNNDDDDDDDDADDVLVALVSTVNACVVCAPQSGRSSLYGRQQRCCQPLQLTIQTICRPVVYSVPSTTSLSVSSWRCSVQSVADYLRPLKTENTHSKTMKIFYRIKFKRCLHYNVHDCTQYMLQLCLRVRTCIAYRYHVHVRNTGTHV